MLPTIAQYVSSRFLWWIIIASLIVLACLFAYNLVTGSTGRYANHGSFILDLLQIPSSSSYATSRSRAPNAISRGEEECRRAVERITGKPFVKARPKFLTNVVTGMPLELDCYNEELSIAIEYNGEQHYRHVPHFHGASKDAFYNTRYRDDAKARMCRENGVRLIVVPYTVQVVDIERYIRDALVDAASTKSV